RDRHCFDPGFQPRSSRGMESDVNTVLTKERLATLLNYDPQTGIFVWLVKRRGKGGPGKVAGCISNRRYVIRVDGHLYHASRLAWLYMTGEWPDGEIDHIDTDSLNNRWENLRDVSRKVNQQNIRSARSNNINGVLGVAPNKGGKSFQARICIEGKTKYLGSFKTESEAHEAYINAKRRFHKGNTL
ncbi:HNH endonuclease signature motif containing protein, partial [Burkholderia multivorans]